MPLQHPTITNDNWHEIQALFDATVGLSREEQTAYLNEHCSGDPFIRNNVEKLLKADTLNHNVLRNVINAEASDFLLSAHPGERLGAYRLIKEIGKGGMGSVFLAERDDDEYKKQVCVKLLSNKLADEQEHTRFRTERQILANLEHPNIGRLLDGGTRDDRTPYLVMEYIDGKPIDQYCDEKQLTVDDRLRLFVDICHAVSYAHQHNVIHCDIKPNNILITKDGLLKLVDFSISRLLEPSGIEDTNRNLMTPAYASPEQIAGLSISKESDIYALGILLYEIVTGINPIALTKQTSTLDDISEDQKQLKKPSLVLDSVLKSSDLTAQNITTILENRKSSIRKMRSRIKGELDSIILKAVNIAPHQRYETADALADDIRNFLTDFPVDAYNTSTIYWCYKHLRRNRVTLSVFTLGILVIVVAASINKSPVTSEVLTVQEVITSHTKQSQDKNRPAIAILPFTNVSNNKENEYLADGITEELINDLSNLNRLYVIAKTSILRYKDKRIDLQTLGKELNAQYFVQGSVQSDDETIQIKAQLFDINANQMILEQLFERPIIDLFAIQNTISEQIAKALNIKITDKETVKISKKYTSNLAAYKYLVDGLKYYGQRFKKANQVAREHFETAIALDPEFARAYAVLANTHRSDYINRWSKDPKTSIELAKKFIKQAESLDPELPQVHFIKGLIFRELKQHAQAMTATAHAITINPNYADGFILLASVMCYSGQPENSIALIKKAMRLSPNHPANYTFHLAQCYFTLGNYQNAVHILEETLERNPASQRAILWLAASYANAGNIQQAQWAIDELMSWNPDITLKYVANTIPYTDKNDMKRLLTGLETAGLQP